MSPKFPLTAHGYRDTELQEQSKPPLDVAKLAWEKVGVQCNRLTLALAGWEILVPSYLYCQFVKLELPSHSAVLVVFLSIPMRVCWSLLPPSQIRRFNKYICDLEYPPLEIDKGKSAEQINRLVHRRVLVYILGHFLVHGASIASMFYILAEQSVDNKQISDVLVADVIALVVTLTTLFINGKEIHKSSRKLTAEILQAKTHIRVSITDHTAPDEASSEALSSSLRGAMGKK